VYHDPPSTFPIYIAKQKMKEQFLFDSWKPILENIESTQNVEAKACKILWNSLDDLLEKIEMDFMLNIDDASPSELRITEVETKRNTELQDIDQIT
jgi:hypothetical protein